MSVTPMKLLTITGPVSCYDDVVKSCILNKPFHPEHAVSMIHNSGKLYAFESGNPFSPLLQQACSLSGHLNMPLAYETFDDCQYSTESAGAYLENLQSRYQALTGESQQLQKTIDDNKDAIQHLENINSIPEKLSQFYSMNYVKFRFGRMPKVIYNTLSKTVGNMDEVVIISTSEKQDFVYLLYLTPKRFEEKIDSMMEAMHFERIWLTGKTGDTPENAIAYLQKDIESANKRLQEISRELDQLRQTEQHAFLSCYSYVRYNHDAFELKQYGAYTEKGLFFLLGWVPAAKCQGLKAELEQFSGLSIAEDDPKEEQSLSPPVLLKNNLLGRIFQPFVEMYGLPAYNEIDPSFLMGITYTILFGIMYGDIGQGVILFFFGWALYRFKGLWLGRILSCVGVSATVFGFVYGSVFGNEEILRGFHVLESGDNTTRILIVAVIIGVSIIGLMMLVNIFNGIKQRDLHKIFFTPNGVPGLIFYCSALVAGAALIVYNVNLLNPVYIILLLILPLLVIFFGEPLGKLVSGDPDWKPESLVGFIMESFFELFEVLLSYITNTVSFLRVGAYAISHAGMMMVVYMLGSTGDGSYNYLILAIGNVIVMGIEGMLVCIQVLRLEFYEMFSRFYSGGGKKYSPKIIDYTDSC